MAVDPTHASGSDQVFHEVVRPVPPPGEPASQFRLRGDDRAASFERVAERLEFLTLEPEF